MFSNFSAQLENGEDAMPELITFANIIGFESIIPNRYSFLLLLQLFGSFKAGVLNPDKVIRQIRILEGLEPQNGVRLPTQFKYPPLKDLWHQHFQEDGLSSLALNVKRGLRKFGMPYVEEKIAQAKAANEERFFTVEDIPRIVDDVISSNLSRMRDQHLITGEWIVFAKHENKNIYLCLAKHQQQDSSIRADLDKIAEMQFPFLKSILCANR